ncbi:IS630 family transposase [Desulfococcaceae bacterium HSG9]|nr:IS630 family transposase [Desulfococcaceae bacterium HSG9]
MTVKKYRVKLTREERNDLLQLTSRGKTTARKLIHAQILLHADEESGTGSLKDTAIAKTVHCSRLTVERVRKRFVTEGLESALNPEVQKRRRPEKPDGKGEAFSVATACSPAPDGRSDRTLRLLADRLIECDIVDTISGETVRKTFKKNELKPWLKRCRVIPPKENADFVCVMEDILEVCHRVYTEDEVLVCMDETGKRQVKETRIPSPSKAGSPEKFDYEYERNGVGNLFMLSAPLEGWRHVKVTDRHTRQDWAQSIKESVDERHPGKKIVLVMDNLNTHKPGSLYATFEPAEARRIAERPEIHYTPKHGSRQDMAEIETGVSSRQCLNRRIPDQETLRTEIAAWQEQRNQEAAVVNWRFTTDDARVKLKSLYPSIQR